MDTKEIWRPIVGFEGLYEVSSQGNARSVNRTVKGKCSLRRLKGKELAYNVNPKTKYATVILSKNGKRKPFYLHILVADAFPEICGKKMDGYEVDHLDFDRTNNTAENLRYVPHSVNIRRRKPKPFKPKYSFWEPLCIENVETNEKHYFICRKKAAEYLQMKNMELLYYYIKKGTPYKKTFLIYTLDEKDDNYWKIKQTNHPTK